MTLDDIKRALGVGGPEPRRPSDVAWGAGAGLAGVGGGLALGRAMARDAQRPERALQELAEAVPEIGGQLIRQLPEESRVTISGLPSAFSPRTGDIRWRIGADVGELAHEIAHAQGRKSQLRRALQRAYSPGAMMLGGPALALGAGLSGNEHLETAAPFLGLAPALPVLAEEGAAAIRGTRMLNKLTRGTDIGDSLRRKALLAMQRKSTHGYLGYLLPALGIASAGYAAPRVADWANREM